MKRAMFLVEVMLEKEIPDHADLIAGRIYGITGTKINSEVSPVTVWQIDAMDSTSLNLAQAIVEFEEAKVEAINSGNLVFVQNENVRTLDGKEVAQ